MGERKTREGVVVSDAMQKTRVVKIERVYRHPQYQRVIRMSKKLKAHDEENASHVGDRVLIGIDGVRNDDDLVAKVSQLVRQVTHRR